MNGSGIVAFDSNPSEGRFACVSEDGRVFVFRTKSAERGAVMNW